MTDNAGSLGTEEQVLHSQTLPPITATGKTNLSQEQLERLYSYMTVPHMRIPLVLSVFEGDTITTLIDKKLRQLVESVFFEPLEHSMDLTAPVILPKHSPMGHSTTDSGTNTVTDWRTG